MNLMTMTTEQLQKIYLLSDSELYEDAVEFVKPHRETKVSETQLSGLQNAVGAGDYNEIFRYIKNRLRRSTTNAQLKNFYEELRDYLQRLPSKVEEAGLVVIPENEDMTRAQRKQVKEEIDLYAYLLATEYIQHLVAEYDYQRNL